MNSGRIVDWIEHRQVEPDQIADNIALFHERQQQCQDRQDDRADQLKGGHDRVADAARRGAGEGPGEDRARLHDPGRASTRDQAVALGLRGYARNLPDGRVEVLAVGDATAVETLADWLSHGPSMARVDTLSRDLAQEDEAGDEFVVA